MINVSEMVELWQNTAQSRLCVEEGAIQLLLDDAAKVSALCEMYPLRTRAQILGDLISVALDQVEGALPYIKGENAIGYDEMGDPFYEDVGPTPRFIALTQKYLVALKQQQTH